MTALLYFQMQGKLKFRKNSMAQSQFLSSKDRIEMSTIQKIGVLDAPRIVVIDDEFEHLIGLTIGLSQAGYACVPIHYSGPMDDVSACPYVRVIFTDFNVLSSSTENLELNLSAITRLIQTVIKPSGPYLVILWTSHAKKVQQLQDYLENRLMEVPIPIAVEALDKAKHLVNGEIKDLGSIISTIRGFLDAQPQFGALLDWESAAQNAVAETVSSVSELAKFTPDKLSNLLISLANAAAGEENVAQDRFAAVNEALLPILADRVAYMRSQQDSNSTLWCDALNQLNSKQAFDKNWAPKLNRLLHIEVPNDQINIDWGKRGAVIPLPKIFSNKNFECTFGLDQSEAAKESFFCKDYEECSDRTNWVLVQVQPACDYAQKRLGPLPYNLGLYLDSDLVRDDRKPPQSLWRSPIFWINEKSIHLHVNATYQISLSPNAQSIDSPKFRLREQILNELIYRIHSYCARVRVPSRFVNLKRNV